MTKKFEKLKAKFVSFRNDYLILTTSILHLKVKNWENSAKEIVKYCKN